MSYFYILEPSIYSITCLCIHPSIYSIILVHHSPIYPLIHSSVHLFHVLSRFDWTSPTSVYAIVCQYVHSFTCLPYPPSIYSSIQPSFCSLTRSARLLSHHLRSSQLCRSPPVISPANLCFCFVFKEGTYTDWYRQLSIREKFQTNCRRVKGSYQIRRRCCRSPAVWGARMCPCSRESECCLWA